MKSRKSEQKEHAVLMSLIELYLKTGEPVGSNTLKESGLKNMSSATIRNYYSKLEQAELLKQLHTSGGRIPTSKALKLYAKEVENSSHLKKEERLLIKSQLGQETKEVAHYLQKAAETITEMTGCATLVTGPRFDQDAIGEVKLVSVGENRLLAVLITTFGLIRTEVLHTPGKINSFSLRRLETYFTHRIKNLPKPDLEEGEEELAEKLYSELILRHIVNYANFTHSEIYKCGFSKMLYHPELLEATALAGSLSLFENPHLLNRFLHRAVEDHSLCYWIGDELKKDLATEHCSVITIPYSIGQRSLGVICLLGPARMEYSKVFALLKEIAKEMGQSLMKSMNKYQITYREPRLDLPFKESPLLPETKLTEIDEPNDE
ncbi:MAG: heat-inducible transcriptional repressor HrcA [Candidatus Algichlamydia australiensis]|nr:heat-inducible transcriptional repressor HrcA [Chlamydiales bacterium]